MKHEEERSTGGVVARARGGSLPVGAEVGEIKDRGHHEISVTRARGGHVPPHKNRKRDGEFERRARGGRAEHEEEEKKKEEKKRRRGGPINVEGKEPGHRNHRRARGGRMSPSEPLSGATTGSRPYDGGKGPTNGPQALRGT